jgi:hypothetical protein
LSRSPSIWANQQLGLVGCTSLANHINASFNHLRFKANATGKEVEGSFVGEGLDELDAIDWNWVDLEVMKEDTSRNTASAVDGPSGCRAKQRLTKVITDGSWTQTLTLCTRAFSS